MDLSACRAGHQMGNMDANMLPPASSFPHLTASTKSGHQLEPSQGREKGRPIAILRKTRALSHRIKAAAESEVESKLSANQTGAKRNFGSRHLHRFNPERFCATEIKNAVDDSAARPDHIIRHDNRHWPDDDGCDDDDCRHHDCRREHHERRRPGCTCWGHVHERPDTVSRKRRLPVDSQCLSLHSNSSLSTDSHQSVPVQVRE
ncbi:hypothetical protein JOB18_001734 [Solea senegalensis]|uniref:Uncharacterized protein n=1 Tax=Solea senegalensis TaxID=28829 RepID=A0AAV6Q906_SOLSE|nr:hypothetical protein JOB18_001734 [Solea senegalensis]